jgi:hypothetical protein
MFKETENDVHLIEKINERVNRFEDVSLDQKLRSYSVKFSKPFDEVWQELDIHGAGQLDQEQTL